MILHCCPRGSKKGVGKPWFRHRAGSTLCVIGGGSRPHVEAQGLEETACKAICPFSAKKITSSSPRVSRIGSTNCALTCKTCSPMGDVQAAKELRQGTEGRTIGPACLAVLTGLGIDPAAMFA